MLEIVKALIGCTILTFSLYFYGTQVFDPRKNKSKIYKGISFVVGCIIHSLIFYYLEGTTKTVLLCFVFSMILLMIFNINFFKAIFASIIYVIMLVVPDVITMATTLYVFNISKEDCYSNVAGSIISEASVSLLMMLLIYILRKPLRKLMSYKISTGKKIILVSILTFCFFTFFFYKFDNAFHHDQSFIIYLVAVLSFAFILFSLVKQKIDNDILQNKYDELLKIMKNYESDVEAQRTQLHETKNEFMTIKSKINDKEENKEIIKYIDSIIGEKINTSNMVKYAKFTYLPANGLKGFFYYKFMEAERNNINVSVNISQSIKNSFLGKIEVNDFKQLVRIIGVYLDNAIEASSISKDKKLGIEIYKIDNDIKIIISNTFVNAVDELKIGKIRFSTKGKNRGHGLLLVKSILSTNKIFETKKNIKDNLYIQELIIKDNIKDEKVE